MGIANCGKAILVAVNTLFAIIGLAFLVVGSLVYSKSSLMDQYFDPIYQKFASYMQNAGSPVDLTEFDIGEFLSGAALAFIIIGVFFFIVGACGWIGACCKVRILLIIYIVILTAIVIGEIVIVIMLFVARDVLMSPLKTELKGIITDKYRGFNSTDVSSITINFAMATFECCGVENASDFNSASQWTKQFGSQQQIPLACCVMNGTYPDISVPDNILASDSCIMAPTASNSYISKGCFEAIEDWVGSHSTIFLGVGIGILVFEIVLIAAAACIIHEEKQKNTKVDKW